MTLPQLYIGNGFTDFVDLVRRTYLPQDECTMFAATPPACEAGRSYLGQTWDMHATAFPYVVALHRLPKDGPASVTLTTTGCLSLIGINEAGIAVGNNNLVPRDAKIGVMYLAMIHHVLAQTSFDAAVSAIANAPRMSGHHYYIGGPAGEVAGIETTGTRHAVLKVDAEGIYAHANHYVDKGLAEYTVTEGGEHSLTRETRMWELLREAAGGLDAQGAAELLRDHEAPICCHTDEPDGSRTCAAVVMCPSERTMWITAGNPCEEEMAQLRP